ncbi:MAG: hypothetical protein M3401_16275 [Actinomycetota bacterium]|nr:hypothetical protein [Actinomycetota bacterium]
MLAWRRLLGETLLEWHGETEIQPPSGLRRDKDPFLRVDTDRYASDLRDERPRLLRPDAVVEVEDPDGGTPLTYLLEFDRTRRVDKNYDKFRRYDCFPNYWWRHTDFGGLDDAPWLIFICHDRDHVLQFINAADHELTGNVSEPWSQDSDWMGRRRIGFCIEHGMYERSPHVWMLPERPRRERHDGDGGWQAIRAWLPGERAAKGSSRSVIRRPARCMSCCVRGVS